MYCCNRIFKDFWKILEFVSILSKVLGYFRVFTRLSIFHDILGLLGSAATLIFRFFVVYRSDFLEKYPESKLSKCYEIDPLSDEAEISIMFIAKCLAIICKFAMVNSNRDTFLNINLYCRQNMPA